MFPYQSLEIETLLMVLEISHTIVKGYKGVCEALRGTQECLFNTNIT